MPTATSPLTGAPSGPSPDWDDPALVDACLQGSEAAWTALVDKYTRLVLSVPRRFRFSQADAEDILQAVCVDLLEQLHTVREPAALRGWLVKAAVHKCLHARRRSGREAPTDPLTISADTADDGSTAEQILVETEQQQLVREATHQLSERCQSLLRLLFVEAPTRPYDEVARLLGVARGSVSFLRGRCLQRLRKALHALGV